MQKKNEQGNGIITEGTKERKLYVKTVDENGIAVKPEVVVSEEVYLTYKRPAWKEHKRQERERECLYKNNKKCDGDCTHCKYKEPMTPLSIDQMEEDGVPLPVADFSVEDYALQKELLKALHTAIASFEQRDQQIINLFSQGLSSHKIAVEVGMSQKGVYDRIHKVLLKQLYELLKDFE